MSNRSIAHEKTAAHLAGEPVIVDFTAPANVNAVGSAMRTFDGTALIRLEPGRSSANEMATFLHELAHVALKHVSESHHSFLPPRSNVDKELEAYVKGEADYSPATKAKETAVAELVARWQLWAEHNRPHKGDWYTETLEALRRYPNP